MAHVGSGAVSDHVAAWAELCKKKTVKEPGVKGGLLRDSLQGSWNSLQARHKAFHRLTAFTP